MMPGIDGVGFRERQLREEFSDIPVVVMTGDLTRSEKLAQLGLASVLKKPYGPEELVRALREAARSNDVEV
jgi:CheY-like chemotaxis protein